MVDRLCCPTMRDMLTCHRCRFANMRLHYEMSTHFWVYEKVKKKDVRVSWFMNWLPFVSSSDFQTFVTSSRFASAAADFCSWTSSLWACFTNSCTHSVECYIPHTNNTYIIGPNKTQAKRTTLSLTWFRLFAPHTGRVDKQIAGARTTHFSFIRFYVYARKPAR